MLTLNNLGTALSQMPRLITPRHVVNNRTNSKLLGSSATHCFPPRDTTVAPMEQEGDKEDRQFRHDQALRQAVRARSGLVSC